MILKDYLNSRFDNAFNQCFTNQNNWFIIPNEWNNDLTNFLKELMKNSLLRYQNANLLYDDLIYADDLMKLILNQHLPLFITIVQRKKDKLELEFSSTSSNKVGYAGFDFDNQDGQFQTNTAMNQNTQKSSERNWKLYLIFKEEYQNVLDDFAYAVLSSMLQVIY